MSGIKRELIFDSQNPRSWRGLTTVKHGDIIVCTSREGYSESGTVLRLDPKGKNVVYEFDDKSTIIQPLVDPKRTIEIYRVR